MESPCACVAGSRSNGLAVAADPGRAASISVQVDGSAEALDEGRAPRLTAPHHQPSRRAPLIPADQRARAHPENVAQQRRVRREAKTRSSSDGRTSTGRGQRSTSVRSPVGSSRVGSPARVRYGASSARLPRRKPSFVPAIARVISRRSHGTRCATGSAASRSQLAGENDDWKNGVSHRAARW